MTIKENELNFYKRLIKGISTQFGTNCEVVLHDLSKGLDKSIVAIENSHVTGRKVGGPSTNIGYLNQKIKSHDITDDYGYITKLPNGKTIRSSSIYIRDDKGEIVGSICINFDISAIALMEGLWRSFQIDTGSDSNNQNKEFFVQDVDQILDTYIDNYLCGINKTVEELSKTEKIELIHYINDKGGFLIRNSSQKICKLLGISKYTLYSQIGETKES